MSELSKSVENIRLASAMEGEHMRPALIYAMALETAHMSEADVLRLVRQARQNLAVGGNEQKGYVVSPAPACSHPRSQRTMV